MSQQLSIVSAEHSDKLKENENSEAGTILKNQIDEYERLISNLEVNLTAKQKQISDFESRESDSKGKDKKAVAKIADF